MTRWGCFLSLTLALACGAEDGGPTGSGSGANNGGSGNGSGSGGMSLAELCASIEGCEFPTIEGPTERLWRVEVRRDASGVFSIGDIRSVRVEEGKGVPLAPANGQVYLVGRDDRGQPVDGQPVDFPSVEVAETFPNVERTETPLDGVPVTQIGYVRALPEIDTLVLFDGDAESLLDQAMVSSADADDLGIVTTASGLTVPADICGNITLIESGNIEGRGQARKVELFQKFELVKAVERLPPTVCLGVSRIAFVDLEASEATTLGVVSILRGDLVVINTAFEYLGQKNFFSEQNMTQSTLARLLLRRTIVHEATHAAENLLDRNAKPKIMGQWNRAAQTGSADSLIGRARLDGGFSKEWGRIHQAFVDRGWAQGYGSFDIPSAAPTDVANGGFMSAYASFSKSEDIAETVTWVTLSTDFARQTIAVDYAKRADFGCIEFRGLSGDSIPSRLAAIYSKMRFLEDLELVYPDEVDDCLNGSSLRENVSEGMRFEGGMVTTFTSDVRGGIETYAESGRRVFYVEAEGQASRSGEMHAAKARLEIQVDGSADIDDVSWPRGYYSLRDGGPHRFDLTFDDEEQRAGNFYSTFGDVLIGASTNDRIRGTIVLQRAWRPFSPFPVPQTFDPPLVIDFLLGD